MSLICICRCFTRGTIKPRPRTESKKESEQATEFKTNHRSDQKRNSSLFIEPPLLTRSQTAVLYDSTQAKRSSILAIDSTKDSCFDDGLTQLQRFNLKTSNRRLFFSESLHLDLRKWNKSFLKSELSKIASQNLTLLKDTHEIRSEQSLDSTLTSRRQFFGNIFKTHFSLFVSNEGLIQNEFYGKEGIEIQIIQNENKRGRVWFDIVAPDQLDDDLINEVAISYRAKKNLNSALHAYAEWINDQSNKSQYVPTPTKPRARRSKSTIRLIRQNTQALIKSHDKRIEKLLSANYTLKDDGSHQTYKLSVNNEGRLLNRAEVHESKDVFIVSVRLITSSDGSIKNEIFQALNHDIRKSTTLSRKARATLSNSLKEYSKAINRKNRSLK